MGHSRQGIVQAANRLAQCYCFGMSDPLADRLAKNVRQLRQARGFTQQRIAKLSELPRATWANIESGTANPTLTVLYRVARALQVPLEELIATPRADGKVYRAGSLPTRVRGKVTVSSLLPDNIPGTTIERIELPVGTRLIGVPHTPGTREYLRCETGELELVAACETYRHEPGDVVDFRGDQNNSYTNHGKSVAV
jgi:transcriptional regulator with XRE-family HTH domain